MYWVFPVQPSLGLTESGSKKVKIFSKQQLIGKKYIVDVSSQRSMVKLLQADRMTTITPITTCYKVCRNVFHNAKHIEH